ncbi:MAG: xanthine dehydrogenase family protein molybdopterin-binding subunit, partial [Betaproteobacteria bacterium]|nr:xanthine dehydrogenase family protein molybdopterin-binding subunit [Betaproteobacteria bacterium]
MRFGRVVRAPRGLAQLAALDRSALESMPGVVLVHEGSFAGVLAEREEAAVKAMRAVRDHSRWEPAAALPGDIHAWLKAHVAEQHLISEKTDAAASDRALTTIEASYTKPYVAHASIGPSCAIAQWSGDTVTVWSHSQGIFNLRRDLALALGMAEDDVVVKHVEGAGCYGHNGADDVALDAALLARSSGGRPVKVQWMREDEFGWEPFGPAMAFALKASLEAGGNIVRWQHNLWSNGHSHRPGVSAGPTLIAASHLARPFERGSAVNPPLPAGGAERNAIPLYEFPNQRVTNHYVREMPVRTSALRSLGAYGNVFAIESFMDELARAAQIDPIAFRLRHLKDPRALDVIRAAAQSARWSEWTRDEGRGHGIGFARYKNLGAYCAVIAEVAAETEVRVARLVIAVDAGLVVNPDGLVNQIEGGAIQSTSWTLKEQVRFDAEGVASLGWEDYPILRFSEVPAVEVVLLDRPELPSVGVGEAAQGPTAAAIANALEDAIGVRVRDLPLDREHIVAAM